MATFRVTVEALTISPHPNADRLELAHVGDYLSIVPRGQFSTGDLAAYIPESAVVPESILVELGLVGKLAGAQKNRVKAMRLRGILSQGLCYAARPGWKRGDDVAEELGITKYEPPVPTHMRGEVYAAGLDRCIRYDIEAFKRYPHILEEGEPVVITEKLHGTWCQIGLLPESMAHPDYGRLVVSSKGLAHQGLAFKPEVEANQYNVYLRAARQLEVESRFAHLNEPIFILGEVFGAGIQDLHYGHSKSQGASSVSFRVFDVFTGAPTARTAHYLDDADLDSFCKTHQLARVPVLYRGPFDRETLLAQTEGPETISGDGRHMREGVVVRPQVERRDDGIGRVQLKSVSESYLLRRGGTEYN